MSRIRFSARFAGALSLFVVVLLILLGGCGGGGRQIKTGKVAGQVTFDGKPVTDGVVHFVSKTGYGAQASLNESGKYSVAVEAAEYQVYVAPHPPGQSGPPGTGQAPKQAASVIPMKYREPGTSGLTFTVEEGKDNKFDIELK
jgi:hypothetical protein